VTILFTSIRPLRRKDSERFCVFRGQQRKQMSGFSIKLV